MKTAKIIPFITTAILVCMIFGFSSQKAVDSANMSRGITQKVVDIIYRDKPEEVKTKKVNEIHGFIRKTAHFTLFFALGISSAAMFYVLGKKPYYAWGFCLLNAITDETHQFFVGGRAPMIKDVVIDAAGAMMGVLVVVTVRRIWGRSNGHG